MSNLASFARIMVVLLASLLPFAGRTLGATPAPAPFPATPPSGPASMTLEQALRAGLTRNPDLVLGRQQRSIAATDVQIARVHPFNPAYEVRLRHAHGPESAGVTNEFNNEHLVLQELEIRGQAALRRAAARAALSRTEWEIVGQESRLVARIIRDYAMVLCRQQKLWLANQAIQLSIEARSQIDRLTAAAVLRGADPLLIRTELDDARAQAGLAEIALETARRELARDLGFPDNPLVVEDIRLPDPPPPLRALVDRAHHDRGDLRAFKVAIAEARARRELQIADRYGNPVVGVDYEKDSSSVEYLGVQMTIPIPVVNTHEGEIAQREAQVARSRLDLGVGLRRLDFEIRAAVERMERSRRIVELYRTQVLPDLNTGRQGVERLFLLGDPSVDILRVIDVRRKQLHGLDSLLDAKLEMYQALGDLVEAVGSAEGLLPASVAVHGDTEG